KNFKLFAGCVLLYIGARLVADTVKKPKEPVPAKGTEPAGLKAGPMVTQTRFSPRRAEYAFAGRNYSFPVPGVFVLCFFVGIAGGIYGIGGGAIVAPFFVAVFKLPVYTVAGAALMGTFITSVAGVGFYHALAPLYPGMAVTPDWALGLLFGLGGMAGMYLGARCQKFVPARAIKAILSVCLVFVAGKYIIGFF
ncbi:MAG: sulfite exporter TauE/SafE family protein, partial [Thermodesulfobacteriota bacterium]|nr:sulfite exporter TauE/SafE family protein [Thermodesulfobacteriota bacterium]